MPKTKVLHIITRMDWGGSPDVVKQLFRLLPKDDFQQYLICGRTDFPNLDTREFFKEFSGQITFLPSLRRRINPFWDCLAFFKICGILSKVKPDIVNTHTAKAGALGRLATFLTKHKKVIHIPHGHNLYGYFGKFFSWFIANIERLLSKFSSRIVVFTELEKRDMLKNRIAEAGQIKVIRPAIDTIPEINQAQRQEFKSQFGIKSGSYLVGTVTRLESVKGAEYFIQAALEILAKRDDLYFLVVGEGALRPALQRRINSAGRQEKIIFTGWRDDAVILMQLMDILVQPSLNEAVGKVLLEAQSLGVNVIATRTGGIPEFVADQVTGVLISPADTKQLVSAILGLLQEDKKRAALSQAARSWARDNFSAKTMVGAIAAIYKEELLK